MLPLPLSLPYVACPAFPMYNRPTMTPREINARLAKGSAEAVARGQKPWPTYGGTKITDDQQLLFDVACVAIGGMTHTQRQELARYLGQTLAGTR